MDFRIDDILNDTIGGISKEVLLNAIAEVVDGGNVVVTMELNNN